MPKFAISIFIVSLLCSTCFGQGSTGLFGYSGLEDTLYSIGTNPPSSSVIGSLDYDGVSVETEYANGFIYLSHRAGADDRQDELYVLDPTTGQVVDILQMFLGASGSEVISAMEYVDGTMYIGITAEQSDTSITTVDLNTGFVDLFQFPATGIGSPIGGMAHKDGKTYIVSSGGSDAALYELSLENGEATFVATILLDGNNIRIDSLEFGEDGTLYASPSFNTGMGNNLLSIDPITGIATDLGSTGVSINSLTSMLVAIPEPGMTAIYLSTLLFSARRRKSR